MLIGTYWDQACLVAEKVGRHRGRGGQLAQMLTESVALWGLLDQAGLRPSGRMNVGLECLYEINLAENELGGASLYLQQHRDSGCTNSTHRCRHIGF